jgi:hypothetical protein
VRELPGDEGRWDEEGHWFERFGDGGKFPGEGASYGLSKGEWGLVPSCAGGAYGESWCWSDWYEPEEGRRLLEGREADQCDDDGPGSEVRGRYGLGSS